MRSTSSRCRSSGQFGCSPSLGRKDDVVWRSIPMTVRTARAAHHPHSIAFAGCLAALVLLSLADVAAAQVPPFTDLRAAALKAMGGQDVGTLEFRGSGWDACLGQAWKITEGWARWEVQEYRRVLDYGAATS